MLESKDPTPNKRKPKPSGAYEKKKLREQERSRENSKSGREIADEFQPVTDKKVLAAKKRLLKSLRLFCRTIFPKTFYLDFSDDHKRILDKMQAAIVDGGLQAIAMPRGSGKTAMVMAACLWAILKGLHPFVIVIAATGPGAKELLRDLRTELETNDELLKYFPEVVYPIRRLEGIQQRRLLWQGELLRIAITGNQIVLPNLPANPAASAIIATAGITGRIRGRKFTRPDGSQVRPSLALVDDPQTDKTAKSETQCDSIELTLNGAVLGLAGPDKEITAFAAITCIRHNDVAERLLDRARNPQWHGEKTRMVAQWPTHPEAEAHWARYAEIRKECMRNDAPLTPATSYYRAHRKEMDEGAVLPWPDRKGKVAISGIQHAYDLRSDRGDLAFEAEYQNNPPVPLTANAQSLDADVIVTRLNQIPRGTVPSEAVKLTAFIDIQHSVLFWMACAWDSHFGGSIAYYGAWPEQNRMTFDLTSLTRTLQDELPNAGIEAQIHNGLTKLTAQLLGREWPRDGGSVARIEKCPIDANAPESTDIVYSFCRSSPFSAIVIPSHGIGFTARKNQKTMNDWPRKPGDVIGHNWRCPVPTGKRIIRHLIFDTNRWKDHAAARLLVPIGGPSAVVLNGSKPEEHRLLASHLTSEQPVEVTAKGNTINEWELKGVGRRNDWWDCFVGNCVAGSMLGLGLKENSTATQAKKAKIPDHMIAGRAM